MPPRSPGVTLSGPALEPPGDRADSLVVLLHGLGADGNDLIAFAPQWRRDLPRSAFVAPDAPEPCDMAPYGRQWFSLRQWTPISALAGTRAAAPVLTAFLEAERERRGLSWDRIALVGFSQGTIMALHVALRLPAPVAGVVGYSGALMGPEFLALEARVRPPILLVHGDADDVVPVHATRMAHMALALFGVEVEVAERPGLGHGIDGEGLRLGAAFLSRRLSAPPR